MEYRPFDSVNKNVNEIHRAVSTYQYLVYMYSVR